MAINKKNNTRGFALLIAVIFMSVMLAIGIAFASLGYKQLLLASSATDSQYAFYAADGALECALLAGVQGVFDNLTNPGDLLCNEDNYHAVDLTPGSTYTTFTYEHISLSDTTCAEVKIYKSSDPSGDTYLFSQGYSVSCGELTSGNPRVSARGLYAHYK